MKQPVPVINIILYFWKLIPVKKKKNTGNLRGDCWLRVLFHLFDAGIYLPLSLPHRCETWLI